MRGLRARFGSPQKFLLALQQFSKRRYSKFSSCGRIKCDLAISEMSFDFLGHINKHFGDQGKYSYVYFRRLPMTGGVLGSGPI